MKILIVLLLGLMAGCVSSKPTTSQATDQQGITNKNIQNDPQSINILAYMLGGSVALSSAISAFYHFKKLGVKP